MKPSLYMFLLVCILSAEATAQFKVGLNFSVDYNSYVLEEEDAGFVERKGMIGGTLGTLVQYQLTNRLWLKSGVGYAMKNHKYVGDVEDWRRINPDDPFLGSGTGKYKLFYLTGYLDVPVEINYKLTEKTNFDLRATIGVVNSFVLHQQITDNRDDLQTPGKAKFYENYLLAAKGGLGFMIPAKGKLGIYLEPQVRVYVTKVPLYNRAPNPIHFGLQAQFMKL